MRIDFKKDHTLVVTAETSVETMALKYWMKEYIAHGDKLLEINTDDESTELYATNTD